MIDEQLNTALKNDVFFLEKLHLSENKVNDTSHIKI